MRAIVFGFDGYNTAGSIRCLGEAGIKPVVILVSTNKRTAVSKSKYIGEIFQVDSVNSGIKLLKELRMTDSRQYLFATSDKIASALDDIYDTLIDYYDFPNAGGKGLLNKYMNKLTMCELAKKSGFIVPWTLQYSIGESLPENIIYPCIIKPQKSVAGSKQDIKIFNSKEELKKHFSYPHATKNYLIQQFIKREYEILLIGFRNSSGKTFVPASLCKKRWIGLGDDCSYGIVQRKCPNIISLSVIRSLLESMDYTGPFSIELGTAKNVPYFYEINLRNDGTINYFTKIGVNIPAACVMGGDGVLDNTKPFEAQYIDEISDFINVIRGRISLAEWWTELRESTVYKYYDKNDKKPFYVFAPRMLRVVAATLYRKLTGRL